MNCVILDIDHFKMINDTYGHDVGDIVLKNISRLFREQIGDGEIVCRLGGEEFALLVPCMGSGEMIEKMEKLRQTVEKSPVVLPGSGESITVTASFGACLNTCEDLEEMLKTADQNLYRAKETGRNRVCY